MNETIKNILWAVVAVAVAVTISAVLFSHSAQSYGAITSPGTQLDYLNITQGIGFGPNSQTIGALSTNIMGVRTVISTTASSTICSIANPFNATSTLINASLNVTTATSTAEQIVFGVGSNTNATTTLIGSSSGIASGALNTLQTSGVASTTDLGVAVGPGQFLNVGTVGPSVLYSGACNALFESAN